MRVACVAWGLAIAAACTPVPPSSGFKMYSDGRVPDKPGASLSKTEMCSCMRCEPDSCCRELEQDAPEVQKDCADGYDFSKCEMAVSSCESSCYQHRWRARREIGCAQSRPDSCCHEQSDF